MIFDDVLLTEASSEALLVGAFGGSSCDYAERAVVPPQYRGVPGMGLIYEGLHACYSVRHLGCHLAM